MKQKAKQKNIELDAKGKILGRFATEVATVLRGKKSVDFVPYLVPDIIVNVINVEKIKVTGKKPDQKLYWHHSGYPGGIKSDRYKDLFAKDPTIVFRKAVWGMLPKNKLRARTMKRLRLYSKEITQ